MLDVKEAAQKASEYFAALYADQGVSKVQLEEVELTDDGQYWLITLSYPIVGAALSFPPKRQYKVFKIKRKNRRGEINEIRKVD